MALYEERVRQFENHLSKQRKGFAQLATVRILNLLALGVAVYSIFRFESYLISGLVALALAVFFAFLVKRHLVMKKDIKRARYLIEINQNELKALTGDHSFNDIGRSYLNFDHPNAFDLDLFGAGSLYQRLSRSTTQEGADHLASSITQPDLSAIPERQKLLQELATKVDWRQNFQAEGLLQRGESGYSGLKSWISQPLEFANQSYNKPLLVISPVVFFLLLGLYAFGVITSTLPIVYFFAQLTFVGKDLKRINRFHGQLSKKQNELDAYANLLQLSLKEGFDHSELLELQQQAKGGSEAIRKFGRLIGLLDSRLNMLMGIILNGVFLWDLRYVLKIEEWKKQNANRLETWVQVIARFEAFNSLANYTHNHPEYCWPELTQELAISARAMGHPFLPEETCVSNDFRLNASGQLVLLSGANMSGKSTFLRTVGLNLIMAHIGLPVCARSFSFKSIPVYTSMRINDSLQESESYFFAELKRLKFIIDTIKNGREIFVLLDEILRGTNSNDKHKGSIGLIKQLLSLKTSGIVASHDITLASLADEHPGKILNRSFEVENENGELVFDYKLREGVCQNLNASYLMEKMGVIEK